MTRTVTELDFRMPEFRDAKPEDYEFRADGKLVRKDRWEHAVLSITDIVGLSTRQFEIDDVVEKVRELALASDDWTSVVLDSADPDDWPAVGVPVELRLEDGSVLRNAFMTPVRKCPWQWNGGVPPLAVVAWRAQPE